MNRIIKLTRILIKAAGHLLSLIVLPAALFLGAASIGAFAPRAEPGAKHESQTGTAPEADGMVTIYLLTSPLHADIALPFDENLQSEFPWLHETRLPLDNPNMAYLGFGWGSRAFYTTAGNYSDIAISSTFTAITGDAAVMRVIGLPRLVGSENVIPVSLKSNEFRALIKQIKTGFELNKSNEPTYLPQYSIGANDAFYAGKGHFNIFNPCNQWAADILHASGVKTGRWTPTTYSLLWSLRWNNQIE